MWIGGASLDVIFVEIMGIDAKNCVSTIKFYRFDSYSAIFIVSPIEFLCFTCRGVVGIVSSLAE
jgi:hypothetical protein